MKLLMIIVAICFLIGTTNSLTYQIFGTKRFNRGVGSQRADMVPQHLVKQPVYEDGYLTNNGYYYYPHHEYHAYGMPTYHGEYKPKAYYYSAGPSYNYYNDREPVSNPLDDLHEEILQENEQERQSDLLQRDDYDDDYYIDPNEKIHDQETTNNFLRNMMEYNRQNEKQQRMQQLHYRQRDQYDQVPVHRDEDYFSEMDVNPDDYQYEPQGEDNFDLQKYWDAELQSMNNNNNNNNKAASTNEYHHRREPDNLHQSNNDQDVEDLKSLSKHEPEYYEEDYKKRYHNKEKLVHANSWTNQKTSVPDLKPKPKEFEDDYSPVDYDDGSWINWDRKRSSLRSQSRMRNLNKRVPPMTHRKENVLETQTSEPVSVRSSTTEASITAYGQKEKYPMDESYAASILDQKNEERANKNFSKNAKAMEKNIYETIKKMITIEQDLKKNGSKMQKRNINDAGSVVKQLDSLKKH